MSTRATDPTANPAAQNAPPLGTAMVNIVIAAQERAFALNMSAMEQVLSRVVQRSEEAASSAAATTAAAQPVQPLLFAPQPVAEPVFRYVAELFRIYQGATSAIAELLAAQTRGEPRQVEALTKEARNQASEAASSAVTAAGSVLTTGIEVTNRLTTAAAQAGQSLATQAATQVDASAQDAERGVAARHNGQHAHRSENRQDRHQ